MPRFTLAALLQSSGRRMQVDLEERLIDHPGELGTAREEIFRRFLRDYLPKRFEVATGFVFDSAGQVSNQMDVIIADSSVCPRFEAAGGKFYFPCESVVATGQVKSSITSEKELRNALDNIASVKQLDRSAGGLAKDTRHGEPIDHVGNYLHQVYSFVFITGKALSEGSVMEDVMDYLPKRHANTWPNVIFAFNKYLVTYACDGGICPNPMHARGLAVQSVESDPEILLRFYLLLGQAIDVTRVASLPYWEYLQSAKHWSANVFFSATGDPPPLLSSL
ncbi:MAG: hypothetical protein KDA93_06880 [Planctomycetaceae bacterium]|nr:hypothetical protein [Planctomycetaceae bacterium]